MVVGAVLRMDAMLLTSVAFEVVTPHVIPQRRRSRDVEWNVTEVFLNCDVCN